MVGAAEQRGGGRIVMDLFDASGWLGPATFTESGISNGIIEVIGTDISTNTPSRFLRLRVSKL